MKEKHVAKWYHLLVYPDWFRRIHQRPERFLGELVKPGMCVADVGCGLGFYSVLMAEMVGEEGSVLAVDFQPEMLNWAKRKASKAGLFDRIEFIQCREDDVMISEQVDFVLSMWMTHEVADRSRFFVQIRDMLAPQARYLLAEPKFHVKRKLYESICGEAESAGLRMVCEPKVGASFAALFAVSD
ncbi:MAG: class I SAM-dependent methyltransferase [Planctomycetes bacterium]|nr:class I SAM-dependent methyltransferase [Planctomycetota bacterium]